MFCELKKKTRFYLRRTIGKTLHKIPKVTLLNDGLTRFVKPQTPMKFVIKYCAFRKTRFEKSLSRQCFNGNEFIRPTFHRIVIYSMLVYYYFHYYLPGTENF